MLANAEELPLCASSVQHWYAHLAIQLSHRLKDADSDAQVAQVSLI